MRKFLLNRFLQFIPTLVFLVLLSFLLLRASPGNPVDRMMISPSGEELSEQSLLKKEHRQFWIHRLGLDLPLFYFSIEPWSESGFKAFIPAIKLHGQNQFHRWLFGDGIETQGIIRGDFGISYSTKQPVASLLSDRIGWTIFFTFFSVFLAYLLSIPIGIKAASNPGSRFDRVISTLLIILFSMPVFWMATLLLMSFSNPDMISIFPASGIKPIGGFPQSMNFFESIIQTIPYLVLPTICYTYGTLAFLSKTMRVSILEVLKQGYIRTAHAKGLDSHQVIWKHALRNALLPLVTVFSHVFPVAISGSIILETIFTIPGMGLTLFQSIDAQDYPVIIAVFTLTGIITMIGFLLSDILYAWIDPRISFSKPGIGKN